MDVVQSPAQCNFALVNLENKFIGSQNVKENIYHGFWVLSILQNAGVPRIFRKCKFITQTIKYLCNMIRPGKQEMKALAFNAVQNMKHKRALARWNRSLA